MTLFVDHDRPDYGITHEGQVSVSGTVYHVAGTLELPPPPRRRAGPVFDWAKPSCLGCRERLGTAEYWHECTFMGFAIVAATLRSSVFASGALPMYLTNPSLA